ncbi:MAG TPA: glucose 1-dehydrogenase [Bacteroidota bacterium]|nr:glucose 1-dehydrogenase [Bacteroidota bacterium]
MRTISVFPSAKKIELLTRRDPTLDNNTTVKLRVIDVGVCGTDREIAEFKYGAAPAGSDSLVIGHECLAEVIETGSDVKTFKAGDLAVPIVRRPCDRPECVPCRAGRPDFCLTGEFTECGIKKRHGFMSDFIVIEERYLVPVPGSLRHLGVLTEPLSVAEKAIAQVWQMQDRLPWIASAEKEHTPLKGYHAVVLGAGPIGLLGAFLLVRAGFKTYVYSREAASSANARLAESIGAAYVPSTTVGPDDLVRTTGNIDVMYEATGVSAFSFKMLPCLGRNGIYIFTGIPGINAPIELDTDTLMKDIVLKNQVIFGTVNADKSAYKAAIADLADFVERWPEALSSLITVRCRPEDFDKVLLERKTGIKNVITFT